MEERISDLTVCDLTERELLIHREELEHRSKLPMVTWLLWFFLGGIGGHRYYLGDFVCGIFMTLTLGVLGFWTLIDACFIPGSLRRNRHDVSQRIFIEISAMRKGGNTAS